MRRKSFARFPILGLSIFTILAMLLSACGAVTPSTNNNSGQPVKGGTWVDDVPSGPDSLLPNGSLSNYSWIIEQALYAPLFYGDATGKILPGIATVVPTVANGGASADLQNWTFKLRPGLVWSDGQPLNADDIKYTVDLYQSADFGAKGLVGFNLIDQSKTQVSADKLQITFHLKQPLVSFVSVWVDAGSGGSPLPKHHFSSMKPGDILKTADNLTPTVVSGPFQISNADTKAPNLYTLVPNPKYYQASAGLPYLSKLVFRIVTESSTILKDIQSGSITSSWFLDVSSIQDYQSAKGYTVVKDQAASGWEAIWFNQKNPALADVNVRKAIALGINKPNLISSARNGFAQPLCTDHPASISPGYQADAKCYSYDPTQAQKILDDAGWKVGADGVRAKNGVRLEFAYATTTLQWRKDDQLLIQSDLQKIGIKLDLKNFPGDTFFGTVLPQGVVGTYDMGEFESTYTYDGDDSSNFGCAYIPTKDNGYSGGNYTFTCNQAWDKLFSQELGAGDANKRQQIFDQLHTLYLQDFPFVTLYGPLNASIAKNTAHNYAPAPMGPQETNTVWNWWCTGGKC